MSIEKSTDSDQQRRKILVATAAGLGGIGVAAVTVPFVSSMAPGEAARAAGSAVEIDVSNIAPGAIATVEWRGKPVWILHRTEEMLAKLHNHTALLVDPDLTQPMEPPMQKPRPVQSSTPTRAIKPPFFVVTAICTHLGCVPLYRPEAGGPELGPEWPGGFYSPCHGSKFDLAGRIFVNVPGQLNKVAPPHQYLIETLLQIGTDEKNT
jgi:ubiquinol-cytochrome c reductase iron-sulfur subunit